ncbi:MAG: phosphatase [Anaerolineaceae bacterium]|nr:MAG: phosphatase [Anaerolineaceae bacterium]
MNSIFDLGIRLIVVIQGLGSWLETPMEIFSFLGTEDFFMILLPVLYWCVDSKLGIRVAFVLLLSTGVNDALKLAFHWPRPYWYSAEVNRFAAETSFGIPSGHSQTAFAVWGMMAAWLKKWWAWLAAGLIVFFIGFSRLYLGVHFPHDVLFGWLVGGLLLWLTVRFWDPVAARLKKMSFGGQALAAFLASLALILLPLIPYLWLTLTSWQPDPAWASFASEAVTLGGAFTSAGTLFGLGVGLAWLERQGGFKTSGAWWKLILRFLLGVAGVLIIRYGLKFVFPEGETVLAYSLRYLRYALIGAWVAGGAPWIFLRLKLAEK